MIRRRKEFIHLDIAPYDELAHEADKDRLIVQNIPYIMKERRLFAYDKYPDATR